MLDNMTQQKWNALTDSERDALRSDVGLTPQLRGLEGWRVEVTDVDPDPDEKQPRRFIVGRSSGWQPCHIEITRRGARGGYSAREKYATVKRIERVQ